MADKAEELAREIGEYVGKLGFGLIEQDRQKLAALLRPHLERERLVLQKPDDMIAWLNDLGSAWAVLRNGRDFLEASKAELGAYWKQLDILLGEGFKLQVALMRLRNGLPAPPAEEER